MVKPHSHNDFDLFYVIVHSSEKNGWQRHLYVQLHGYNI